MLNGYRPPSLKRFFLIAESGLIGLIALLLVIAEMIGLVALLLVFLLFYNMISLIYPLRVALGSIVDYIHLNGCY